MKVLLCGAEIDLNINMTDAAEVEKLEKKVDNLVEQLSEIEMQRGKKFSQIICEEVQCTSNWLDEHLGEGIGEHILKDRTDLKDVYGIIYTMKSLHRIYMDQIVKEALADYTAERAQRK